MLAVKLHKKKHPWLGKGSHLVPILNWETGKHQVREWIKMLNRHNRKRPNNAIRYITLIRIPSSHPVFIAADWFDKYIMFDGFQPADKSHEEVKKIIQQPPGRLDKLFCEKANCWGFHWPYPEVILGQSMPGRYVLWTKNLLLLYCGNKKN